MVRVLRWQAAGAAGPLAPYPCGSTGSASTAAGVMEGVVEAGLGQFPVTAAADVAAGRGERVRGEEGELLIKKSGR